MRCIEAQGEGGKRKTSTARNTRSLGILAAIILLRVNWKQRVRGRDEERRKETTRTKRGRYRERNGVEEKKRMIDLSLEGEKEGKEKLEEVQAGRQEANQADGQTGIQAGREVYGWVGR